MHPLHRIRSGERQGSGEQLVKRNSERIEITSRIDGAIHPASLFWRHVRQCPCDKLRRFRRALAFTRKPGSETETGEPAFTTRRIYQNIARLDVFMDNPALM